MVLTRHGAPSIQDRISKHEQAARLVRSFQPLMVIGLLQTEKYIGQILSAGAGLSEQDAAATRQIRLARQRRLQDPDREFRLIMTEGALRWPIGNPLLMAEQLDAIAEVSALRPNVHIGVIPATSFLAWAPMHPIHLYDTDAALVATEDATGIVTAAADVAEHAAVFAKAETAAQFGEQAREHLARIAADFRQMS
jgi:uncharacterized protein DUF5753